MSHEIWQSISGYIGKYEVSNLGNVRSLYFKNNKAYIKLEKPRILKPSKSNKKNGYLRVKLSFGNEVVTYSIHRLVLTAFVGPSPDKYHAAHLNGNPLDNRLVNLKWVPQSENELHKLKHGTKAWGEKQGNASLTLRQVSQMRNLRKSGKTVTFLARKFRVTESNVSAICLGKSWKYSIAADDDLEKK